MTARETALLMLKLRSSMTHHQRRKTRTTSTRTKPGPEVETAGPGLATRKWAAGKMMSAKTPEGLERGLETVMLIANKRGSLASYAGGLPICLATLKTMSSSEEVEGSKPLAHGTN